MRFNSLQFGKAISAALFVLLLVVVGSKNALAQNQVATLQHGEDISVFYGQNAFVEAHNAAETGDIITLSSGTFTPITITKAITLRGAGCAVDTVSNTEPTVFGGYIELNVNDTDNYLTIEGILFGSDVVFFTLNNPKFNKCNITHIGYYNGGCHMNNAQFVNCFINQFDPTCANNTTFINSVVWNAGGTSNNYTVLLYNSIMRMPFSNSGGLSAYNSIIAEEYSYGSTSAFVNCIGIGNDPFGNGYTTGCATYTSYDEVFDTFAGSFSFDEPFILKDEIATGFLGNDGTEVGIHGGTMPYSSRPTYMVMKRCNVANKSTIDGKLSVDIEVVTEEE
jgi:hypothetical protein